MNVLQWSAHQQYSEIAAKCLTQIHRFERFSWPFFFIPWVNFVKFFGITVVLQGHRKKISVWSLNASLHPKCALKKCYLVGFNFKHWFFTHICSPQLQQFFQRCTCGSGKVPSQTDPKPTTSTKDSVYSSGDRKFETYWNVTSQKQTILCQRLSKPCVNDCPIQLILTLHLMFVVHALDKLRHQQT